jgi:hypothetical protein
MVAICGVGPPTPIRDYGTGGGIHQAYGPRLMWLLAAPTVVQNDDAVTAWFA